jgi:hypothetical protein
MTHAHKANKILSEINDILNANLANGLQTYAGLTSAEIGRYNRAQMFGEDDGAFPTDAEWATIVD